MANDYFQFKQFIIHQSDCAMKVSTDACLFGSIIDIGPSTNILDIGSGTALLPLMLAQRSSVPITGVEINRAAYLQSIENINESPWKDQLKIVNQSIQDYAVNIKDKYDLIISNPPFFNNSLRSKNENRLLDIQIVYPIRT